MEEYFPAGAIFVHGFSFYPEFNRMRKYAGIWFYPCELWNIKSKQKIPISQGFRLSTTRMQRKVRGVFNYVGNILCSLGRYKLNPNFSFEQRGSKPAGENVQKAGGTIVSKPEEFGEGYYGFVFADPDGHKFNIFYMEGL